MAQAPMAAAGGSGGMTSMDASAGGMGMGDPSSGDPTAPDDSGTDTTIVTICKTSDGSYMVYAGDPPGADPDDTDPDDADAMAGGAGMAPPAPGGMGVAAAGLGGQAGGDGSQAGQPADSIGAALKIALDLLNADKSSEGMAGNADDQMAAGFSASKSPTPASSAMAQKY